MKLYRKFIIFFILINILICYCALPLIYIINNRLDYKIHCKNNNTENKKFKIILDIDTFILLFIIIANFVFIYYAIYKNINDARYRFNYYFSFTVCNILLFIKGGVSIYLYIIKCNFIKSWINDIIFYILVSPYIMSFINSIILPLLIYEYLNINYIQLV